MVFPYFLHVTLAIFQAFDNEGDISFLEGVKHTAPIAFYRKDTFHAHVLQVMRSQGLLAIQHGTYLTNR